MTSAELDGIVDQTRGWAQGGDVFAYFIAPFGPVIVTADEIPDPQNLDLWLTINGVEKQRSNTAKMLFKVDELIADISQGITLEPGDIIASGTPEGVGAGRGRARAHDDAPAHDERADRPRDEPRSHRK
jgi:2-keto-4-pentenoate hydratase/2-oxohepta-3-ene-1,7-dioic acid hydratase in catechol pathway